MTEQAPETEFADDSYDYDDNGPRFPPTTLSLKKKSGCELTLLIFAPHAIHVNEGGDDPLKLKIEPIHVKDPHDNVNVTQGPSGGDGDNEKMKLAKQRKRLREDVVQEPVQQPTFSAEGNGQIPVAFLEVVEKEAVRRCRAIHKIEKDMTALKDNIMAALPSVRGTGPETEKVCPPLDTSQQPTISPIEFESDDDKEDEESEYCQTELPVPSPDVVTDPESAKMDGGD